MHKADSCLFAGVRKRLNRKELRWYGVRVAEPHHDGTVHWHMMIFAHPDERNAIVNIVREFAIREDRAELGDDITPRFKSELITKEKGSPTSYIATYIGKNVDGAAVGGIDPKTGKPRVDNESGQSMADSVEHVIGWAGLHGVRQFQFFGIPSRQAYRELRRLAVQMARQKDGPKALPDKAMDNVLVAADAGCFASYISSQGGVLIPRKHYLVRTAYDVADKLNDYGEAGIQIFGIWSPVLGEESRVCTHPDSWEMVRKRAQTTADNAQLAVDPDLRGGPDTPWTRGNNCPHEQNANNSGGVFDTNKEQENIDFGKMNTKQRREMLKRIRETPTEKSKDKLIPRPPSRAERLYMPERQEQAEKLADFAHTIGIDLSKTALRRLMLGETVDIEGLRYAAGFDNEIRLVSDGGVKRRALLRERIAKLNPATPAWIANAKTP